MTKKVNCIMLIDDNPDDNFFHKRAITKSGMADHVLIMQTAMEALDYFSQHNEADWVSPDLVFLDINMPGMTGWEFLEEYDKLALSDDHHVIVVMLTTSENPDDIIKAGGIRHVSSYYTKPLTAEMLQEVIDKNF